MGIRWIPVTERRPDDMATVMVYAPNKDEPVWMAYLDEGKWIYVEGFEVVGVTHWADLPEPPGSAPIESQASNLVEAAKDLLSTIDLHTDCMSNQIDREALEPWMDIVEGFLIKEEKNDGE